MQPCLRLPSPSVVKRRAERWAGGFDSFLFGLVEGVDLWFFLLVGRWGVLRLDVFVSFLEGFFS